MVGAGAGGLVAAAGAAGVGARVAIIEEHLMGGDCLNVGCVPSKALVRCARAAHEVRCTSFALAPRCVYHYDRAVIMDMRLPHDWASVMAESSSTWCLHSKPALQMQLALLQPFSLLHIHHGHIPCTSNLE